MKQRLLELDLMRGIAMISVIIGHISEFSLHADSYPRGFMGIVQMPLFFAVSGFLTYKPLAELSLKNDLGRLLKRSRMLLVPLLVWSFIHYLVIDDLSGWVANKFVWGGYWFFIALWWLDVINTVLSQLSQKYQFGLWQDLTVYGFIYGIIVLLRIKGFSHDGFFQINALMFFFPVFTLTYLMKKYERIYRLVLNEFTYALGLLLLLVAWYLMKLESFPLHFLGGLGGVIVIWQLFKSVNPGAPWVKLLSLIGRNTLPIYAIHYLFITSLPEALQNMVNVPMGFFLQFTVEIPYMIAVVILCLVTNHILSANKFIKSLFFGSSK